MNVYKKEGGREEGGKGLSEYLRRGWREGREGKGGKLLTMELQEGRKSKE